MAEYNVAECVELGHNVCVVDATGESPRTVCLTDDDLALGGPEDLEFAPPAPPQE